MATTDEENQQQQQNETGDDGLGLLFKQAATSLTNLYRKSNSQRKSAYLDGYVQCLRDIATHCSSSSSSSCTNDTSSRSEEFIPLATLFHFLNTRFAQVVQQQQQQQNIQISSSQQQATESSSSISLHSNVNCNDLPTIFNFNSSSSSSVAGADGDRQEDLQPPVPKRPKRR